MKKALFVLLALLIVDGAAFSQNQEKPLIGTVKSADGVEIRYEVRGNGSPALVFVHCWQCDRSYWEQQLPHYAAKYTVVALDLAGHGESGRNRTEWSPTTYARDVQAVIEHLKLPQVILIGHSMGGPVVAQAALLLPGKVLSIVGIDTFNNIGLVPDPKQMEPFFAAMKANFAATTDGFIRGMMFPAGADPALVDRIAKDMSSGPADIGIASMESLWKLNLGPVLEQVGVPVYCVNADKFPTDTAAGQKYARLFKVRILPGTGHFLFLEKPGEFNKLLDETLADILGAK